MGEIQEPLGQQIGPGRAQAQLENGLDQLGLGRDAALDAGLGEPRGQIRPRLCAADQWHRADRPAAQAAGPMAGGLPGGGKALTKKYADMTVPERWEWHAGIYAFRRVVLDIDERTSPCDAEGVWFDARLVDAAERRLRAKRAPQRRASDEEMQRE